MIILPSQYFGNTEYWAAIVQGGSDVVIDLGENYVKRSERNRTTILTSGGTMQLTVQLAHANRPRQPMRSMQIDYSKRWQHQHLIAMESAYRSSPYYDYYGERFTSLYATEWRYLVDLNMATLERICSILKVGVPRITESYITASEGDIDLRQKRRTTTFVAEPYIQVFNDRLPFEPNLSIFDLVMCEGPAANELLARCRF
ncbi:MAG: WbqC family protein [Alistipes sp.]|nr:WbqC family protein [Alistipes sp.]